MTSFNRLPVGRPWLLIFRPILHRFAGGGHAPSRPGLSVEHCRPPRSDRYGRAACLLWALIGDFFISSKRQEVCVRLAKREAPWLSKRKALRGKG